LQSQATATTVWAPSGPGSEVVVIAGQFTAAGDTLASGIATWDGTNWQPLGGTSSSPPSISALAVYQGQLYAGGSFADNGGIPVSCIARWNGAAWEPLGDGLSGGTAKMRAVAWQQRDCVTEYERALLVNDDRNTQCMQSADNLDSVFARAAERLLCGAEFLAGAISAETQFVSCCALKLY